MNPISPGITSVHGGAAGWGWLHEGGARFSTKDLFSIPRGVVGYPLLSPSARLFRPRSDPLPPPPLSPLRARRRASRFLSSSSSSLSLFRRSARFSCGGSLMHFRENRPRRRGTPSRSASSRTKSGARRKKKSGGWLPVTSFSGHLALPGGADRTEAKRTNGRHRLAGVTNGHFFQPPPLRAPRRRRARPTPGAQPRNYREIRGRRIGIDPRGPAIRSEPGSSGPFIDRGRDNCLSHAPACFDNRLAS